MKYLYSWLREVYPDIPSLEEVQPLLIQLGHDIEEVTPVQHPNVVVAEILSMKPHPNAERLSLVTVTDGKQDYEVVCGAPKLRIGQKVAYAPVGSELTSGLKINVIKVRGVSSSGMLCAEDELGLGPSHSELLPMPDTAKLGDPIDNYLSPDAVLSLDITRDRGDVLSHFGLARDIKAGHEHALLAPSFLTPTYNGDTKENVDIDVIHPDAQAISLGLVVSDREAPSIPLLYASRLHLLGYKSINLATDLTNYLLLEFGQPLHAYDIDALGDKTTFGVRRAKMGEQLIGLNGVTYRLTPQSLVITNRDIPVALAGVLGGEQTKTQKSTTNILLECATFNPKAVSLMARGLNTFTESALRFERGVDPNLRPRILAHAQALWQQLTGGKIYQPIEKVNELPHGQNQSEIAYDRLNQFIGMPIAQDNVTRILSGLGCQLEPDNQTKVKITPPSWRFDLTFPEDYYEEVVRVIGLETIVKKPLPASVPQWKRSRYWRIEGLKDMLVSTGAYEISTYPFTTLDEATQSAAHEDLIELAIPAQENKDFMRPSLIPGMLTAIAANPEIPEIYFFEIARIYLQKREELMLCLGTSGSNQIDMENWWRNLFERLHLPVSSWMARVKTISKDPRQAYKIRKPFVMVLELPVDDVVHSKLFESPQVQIPDLEKITYLPPAKFQSSRRDIAFVIDTTWKPEQIADSIKRLHPYISSVELFDTYTDNKLGKDKHSLAYHIFYQSPERTLTSEEIQEIHQLVEKYLQEHYHGIVR